MMTSDELQTRLAELAAGNLVPGAAAAILYGEETVSAVTGTANMNTGAPVVPDTLFASGSICKVFTSSLIMTLVDDGAVELDAPVQRYSPDFTLADPVKSAGVTVRMLLSHTLPHSTGPPWVARVWMTAGAKLGFWSKLNPRNDFSRENAAALMRHSERRRAGRRIRPGILPPRNPQVRSKVTDTGVATRYGASCQSSQTRSHQIDRTRCAAACRACAREGALICSVRPTSRREDSLDAVRHAAGSWLFEGRCATGVAVARSERDICL
jgi:hypothetical protein